MAHKGTRKALRLKEDLRKLHAEGLWDNEIARRLGISPPTVKRWRGELGLQANMYNHSLKDWSPVVVDGKEASTLYDQGLSDWNIGVAMGLDVGQIRRWRIANGLHPNARKNWTADMRSEAQSLYNAGCTDRESAEKLGVSPESVRIFRLQNNLDAKHHIRINERRAMSLYQAGLKDLEIARELGVTDTAINGWRERNGLASNAAPKQYVPEDYDWTEVDRMLCEGVKQADISRQSGLTPTHVRNRMAQLGIQRKRGAGPKLRDEDILPLYNAGKTDREIAEALGVSKSTIFRWRQRTGRPSNT